jgi:hypothetical protein
MRSYKLVAASLLAGLIVACGSGKKNDDAAQNSPTTPAVSPEEKAARDAVYSEVPGHAIVRVPVNEKGETIGAPEMRVVSSKDAIGDATQAVAAFDSGSAPQKMVAKADELDGDSSTQSWSSWDYYDTYNSGGNGHTGGGSYNGGSGYGSSGGYGHTGGGSYNGGSGYGDDYDNDWGDYDDDYDSEYGDGYGSGGNYGGGGCGSNCGNWGHNYWQSSYKPVLYYKNYGWNYGAYRPTYWNQGGYNYYCYGQNKNW